MYCETVTSSLQSNNRSKEIQEHVVISGHGTGTTEFF